MAETSPRDREQLVNVYQDYEDLWNGDFSNLDVIDESITFYDPGAPVEAIRGRNAFEAYLREIRTAFPDWHIEVDDLLVGDGVIMKEWTITGTHEGEFDDIPPTGRDMEISGMAKILIEDGKVQEDRLYFNPQDMYEQLGLTEE